MRVNGLEVESVGILERELGRVLDHPDPLGRIKQVCQRAQERRLASAGLTGDEDVRLRPDHLAEEIGHLRTHAALGHPVATMAAAGDQVEAPAYTGLLDLSYAEPLR